MGNPCTSRGLVAGMADTVIFELCIVCEVVRLKYHMAI